MTAGPRYELLAVDLDGTLVGATPEVSARAVRALKAAADRGVRVTIATGRMFLASRPYAELLGVTTPIICYQGAQIRDPNTGVVIEETPVARALAAQVIDYCRERGYHVNAFAGDQLYMAELTPEGRFYAERANVEPKLVGDLATWLTGDVLKLVIVTDAPTTEKIVGELSTRFEGQLYVTRSFPIFAETINAGVSKGKALRRLADRLGIAMGKVMAIGDDLNDIEMVASAGFGVAMGNAAPEVKSRAKFITGSVEEDGVATAVERFILDQHS